MYTRFRLPIVITENGVADDGSPDDRRRRYLMCVMQKMSECVRDGVDVRGFCYWSLMDNFEWAEGFGPRFGLFYVNYDTMERSSTSSAELYRNIISAHQTAIE